MLFPYDTQAEMTPSAVKIQKENLKQFELTHFTELDIDRLIANRTAFYDHLLQHLWRHFRFEELPLSLIAVGGYGREEMFPLSDLDILILAEQPISADLQENIAQFVQFLWDCNFNVGHSIRTLAECETEGKADITIATNLLEARYLCGHHALFEQLVQLVRQEDFWSKIDFCQAKIQEKITRYQRYNNTSYNLEPDIKYSPGGLRDLHLLYWIALRHNGAKNLQEILQAGFIYPAEHALLLKSQQFLFKVRYALHLILKRYDNRLLFDRQLKVSELLGFQGEGNLGVETMMKRFFRALHSISLLSELLVKHYQEHFLIDYEIIHEQVLDENFSLINQAICLRNQQCFERQPDSILDLFYYLTQYPDAEIHSSVLRELHLTLEYRQEHQLSYLCESPSAREKFIRLFNQPLAIKRAFFLMHQYGVLTAYLPQWRNIVGLMQFDLFHCYTVDEHILRVMLKLESFLSEESAKAHTICYQIFSQIPDRTLLYIAALFHDIAKGRGGEHEILGAVDVREFARLHGFDQRETETMAWLVEQHLLMSVTAQRRDIHDPEVVLNFAVQVCNQVCLDYLTCLTVADIVATNETLWNSWKRSLMATLYDYTKQQFSQGLQTLLDNQAKAKEHQELALLEIRAKNTALSALQIEKLWQHCPMDYFLRNSPQQISWHTCLLAEFKGDLLVKVSNRFSGGGTEIFIYTQDCPNLFNKVVTTIGAKKLSIHDAQIITAKDGYVLDSFIVTELDGSELPFDRRRMLETALTESLTSGMVNRQRVREKHQLAHFKVKTEVRFLNLDKTDQTEMELFALDRAGLLADVSAVFCELELNLCNAKITTIGEKAEDFFILTNKEGRALNEMERKALLERLLHVLN
ncbi:bifunctional uridylyltransferase/uridylyl-removing protein GlnD [Aggregatibacter kilianii]|uniref:bifunctional uridylyltransferase/uridylyl-removing protein GlnD n=1 Tax=Aggregatibacter kilianii TaxID=2025884 RepID=UPI0028F13447|nr:bifunctional uridylyltransferase/uridylyl-removing protein GlnD [Aggregatibacter kilianii]